MEGWLNLRDELDGQIFQASETENGFDSDLNFRLVECCFDESKSSLRSLFDQVLVIFLEEMSLNKCIRPLPVMCPDGLPVDLFKLFWVVKRVGGYDLVSRRNLWGFVAEECGLGFGAIPFLKLIYIKYLNGFDCWLRKGFAESGPEDSVNRVVKKLEFLLQNMEKQNRGLFGKGRNGDWEAKFDKTRNITGSGLASRLLLCSRDSNAVYGYAKGRIDYDEKYYLENDNVLSRSAKLVPQKISKKVHDVPEGKKSDGKYSSSQGKNGTALSAVKVIEKPISSLHDSIESLPNSNGKGIYAEITDRIMLSAKNMVDKVHADSRKRKRKQSLLSETLNWLLYVAKHPDNPAVGCIPEFPKWKDEGDEEYWYQVLLAREALMIKRCANANVGAFQQKKIKMHPSLYEDVLNQQSADKSRSSQRLPVAKFPNCSCCNSALQTKIASPQKADSGNCPKKSANDELSAGNKTDHVSLEKAGEKEVSVGPLFQAEVPEWTGEVFESDSKWLGERMWPEDTGDETVNDLGPIGKGKPDPCDCLYPRSTECIRFHIAEKRLKLKRELGSLFYKWRFNHMGEEVSLSWTREEEDKFKNLIKLHSSSTNKFWNNASNFFPSKTRAMLVSYYFNVFLIQRRNYQNRVAPKDIDSDDDEKEFGSVGDKFGYKALHVPHSRLPICLENKQCYDFE